MNSKTRAGRACSDTDNQTSKSKYKNCINLVHSLLNLAETNIEMHLLLLQLAPFLIEQVGVLVDEVQVVARSDGHRVTASFSQAVVRLFKEDVNT